MDKRVERTKGTIRRTLLSLMGERPVERITTTELCREAHINRNTFYAHYGSPEDVLREVEDELVASIGQELRKGYEEGGVTLAMPRHVARHQELYRALWRCKSSRLKERAMDLVIGRSLGVWRGEGLSTLSEGELFLRYAAQGSLAVVERWLYDGCRATPEEITELIDRFTLEGKRGLGPAQPAGCAPSIPPLQ